MLHCVRAEEEVKTYKDYFYTSTVRVLNFQANGLKKTSQIHKRIYGHVIFLTSKKTGLQFLCSAEL